jgi:hypothetical protein
VVGTGADFHADEARRQRVDEFQKVGARDSGPNQSGLARLIEAMNRKDVLRQIDVNGYDFHELPLPTND